ncbi:MAG: hypothetical protein ABMA64_06470 [Myxococcota bacterium]
MGPVGLILAAAAWGQQPAPADEEIVVWGQLARERARDAVVHALEDLGYEVVRRDGEQIVLRPPSAWTGRATLHEDGTLSFGRPAVGFRSAPPEAFERAAPLAPSEGELQVGGPSFWLLPSARKRDAANDRVLEAVHGPIVQFEVVSQRTALENQLALLPEQLDALWASGAPLPSGTPGPLATAEDRRRAVLAYWASRTDTAEGTRVAEVVEKWLSNVVQPSGTPITDAERAEYEARRTDGRRLP